MEKDEFKLDFIGIGAQKSGTTWLAQCLGEHPQIFIPKIKELFYFSKDALPVLEKEKLSYEQYKKYFHKASAGQIKGEFTPLYLYDEHSPGSIKELFPGIKILVIIRDPIYRAYSHYRHIKMTKPTSESFSEMLKTELALINWGQYYKWLKKYYEIFPKENIKVIIYEEFKRAPEKFLKELFIFLQVSPDFIPPSAQKRVNVKKDVRNEKIRNLKYRLRQKFFKFPLGRMIIKLISLLKINELLKKICYADDHGAEPIDNATLDRLKEIFKEDKINLEKLLGKKLDHWLV